MAQIFRYRRYAATAAAFFFAFTGMFTPVQAQVAFLPVPGTMVQMTPKFDPVVIKGVKFHPDNPFQFDFIVDAGNADSDPAHIKREGHKLISFFLAALTTPEKDMWVNLSPYEKQRVIPAAFGQTVMGKELLAQDYLLKQIMATALYPEKDLGREFWQRVYAEAAQKFGTTNVPVNTFNKVWILPDKASVYENSDLNAVFVVDSSLKVMLEQDYLSAKKHSTPGSNAAGALGAQIIREVVIPALEREVNEGKNFAPLRQVYQSLILATWYKQNLKDNVLTQSYADHNKILGVNVRDKAVAEKIYHQYLQAYRKGVYNFIKEETDPATGTLIPRKYFSGGFAAATLHITRADQAMLGHSVKKIRTPMILMAGVLGVLMVTAMSNKAEAANSVQLYPGANVSTLAIQAGISGGKIEQAIDAGAFSYQSGGRINHITRATKNFIPSEGQFFIDFSKVPGSTPAAAAQAQPAPAAAAPVVTTPGPAVQAPSVQAVAPTFSQTVVNSVGNPAVQPQQPQVRLPANAANLQPQFTQTVTGSTAGIMPNPQPAAVIGAGPPPQEILALNGFLTQLENHIKTHGTGFTAEYQNSVNAYLEPRLKMLKMHRGDATGNYYYAKVDQLLSAVNPGRPLDSVAQMRSPTAVQLASLYPTTDTVGDFRSIPRSVAGNEPWRNISLEAMLENDPHHPPTLRGMRPEMLEAAKIAVYLYQQQYPDDEVVISSGFRDLTANKAAGGADNSYHMRGIAMDLKARHISALERIFASLGVRVIHETSNRMHGDMENSKGVSSDQILAQIRQRASSLLAQGPANLRYARNDRAMTNGGINLGKTALNTASDGRGVKTAFSDPAMLQLLRNVQGLTPVIYKVEPATLPVINMLLGLKPGLANAPQT